MLLQSNYLNINVYIKRASELGGDYMILVCRDQISIRPAGSDFTLRLHGGI